MTGFRDGCGISCLLKLPDKKGSEGGVDRQRAGQRIDILSTPLFDGA
jgi:hypothetical protein